MPIHFYQDENDPNLIWQIFEGKWTLDEYIQDVDELTKLINTRTERIDVIADLTKSGTPPAKLLSISGYLERHNPENRGAAVIVGSGMFVKTLVKISETIAPRFTTNLYTADTVDEAHAIIAKARAEVNQPEE